MILFLSERDHQKQLLWQVSKKHGSIGIELKWDWTHGIEPNGTEPTRNWTHTGLNPQKTLQKSPLDGMYEKNDII